MTDIELDYLIPADNPIHGDAEDILLFGLVYLLIEVEDIVDRELCYTRTYQ
jgi:hypothetical protein